MRTVNRRSRTWTAALLFLCAGSLWLQFKQIDRTLPYPSDVDEGYVAGPAARIVTTGTFHPYTFNYPSLPKYLAAVGMAAGLSVAPLKAGFEEFVRLAMWGFPTMTPRA